VDEVARAVERLVDRLRTLGLARLERPGPSGVSVAGLTHRTCVAWAGIVHGSHVPTVPELAPMAAGDQLAVIGRELVTAWRRGELTDAQKRQVMEDLVVLRAAT
jgi:hypothetical protein